MNTWVDITDGNVKLEPSGDPYDKAFVGAGFGSLFWFDESSGRLFLRYRYLQPRYNSLCITYRYGSQEPVPAGIKRLCNLIVATNILSMDFYSVKVGMGGDISGLRDQAMSRWQDEQARLYSSFQRSGSVHSMYR